MTFFGILVKLRKSTVDIFRVIFRLKTCFVKQLSFHFFSLSTNEHFSLKMNFGTQPSNSSPLNRVMLFSPGEMDYDTHILSEYWTQLCVQFSASIYVSFSASICFHLLSTDLIRMFSFTHTKNFCKNTENRSGMKKKTMKWQDQN